MKAHDDARRRGAGPYSKRVESAPPASPGRRRRKFFDSRELQLLLLALIAETPRHGYELIREVEERTNGAYAPSPGMVYPTLTMLVEMGHAEEAEASGSKKVFAASDEGRAALAEQAELRDALFDRLTRIAERMRRVDAQPVHRAMHNLKSAVHERLSREGVEDDTIFAVAQMIDEAAGRVERLK